MMLVPRGFATRLARRPWLTISLVVVNVGFFAIEPGYSDKLQKTFFRELAALAEPNFANACRKQGGAVGDCTQAAATVQAILADPEGVEREFGRKGARLERGDWVAATYLKSYLDRVFATPTPTERATLHSVHARFDVFSAANLGWRSLLNSQFRHSDVFHLLGNMFVLVTAGIWLEQRLRRGLLAAFYLVGGSIGFWAMAGEYRPLIGNSAAVAAVLGLFLVFFGRLEMRVQLFAPPIAWARSFYAPVWAFLIAAYLASDLEGLLNPLASPVAFRAHLGGWIGGITFGLLVRAFENEPHYFVYRGEADACRALRDELRAGQRSVKELREHARELLELNRENRFVRECAARLAVAEPDAHRAQAELDEHLPLVLRRARWPQAWPQLESLLTEAVARGLTASALARLELSTLKALARAAVAAGTTAVAEASLAEYARRHPRAPEIRALRDRLHHPRIERSA